MLFSIAIPAYKSDFLKECIDSVLKQTVTDFELIIINDCSPEPVENIISLFNDPRIRYFKNDVNIGAEHLVNNWNNCLEKATGEFFVMMGDDDKMENDFLEEFSKLIKKYPDLDVYHCRSKIIDEYSVPFKLTPSWPEYESVYENIWHRLYGLRLQYISDFVYRTKTLKMNGGFYYLPLAWGSDDITSYIACGTKGIAHTNKPVFNYRESKYTISSSGNNYKKITAFVLRQKWLDEFLQKMPVAENDKILFNDLKPKISKLIKEQKIFTMAKGLQADFFKNFILYAKSLKDFHLSLSDLLKASIKSFKI